MLKLILVSKSPRRHKILKEHGYKFTSCSVETSEFFDKNLSLNNALKAISRAKVEAFMKSAHQEDLTQSILLGCDTVVCLNMQVLGKPKDKNQAFQYLSLLSGNTHEVKTAVSLFNGNCQTWHEFIETSHVTFHSLSDEEINSYTEMEEPYDKAGGYAIQGYAKKFVNKFTGSWYNIVGLPIESFQLCLKENNWVIKTYET